MKLTGVYNSVYIKYKCKKEQNKYEQKYELKTLVQFYQQYVSTDKITLTLFLYLSKYLEVNSWSDFNKNYSEMMTN